MKLTKILATAALITCFTATAAFAAPDVSGTSNTVTVQQQSDTVNKEKRDFKGKGFKNGHDWMSQKDPVKALESKKQKIQEKLKEGKITKEQADAINARIDSKLKEIKEFNSLTLQQKRDKLKADFKAKLDKGVKEGKLTQEKADEVIKKFTEKVDKWDGTGYPMFHKKGFKCHKKAEAGNNQ
ncbi:MAG: hypothetical protein N3B21_02440 [Clostridia bacterium]|nr:hypothetical protein [Clostridia bacterium]